MSTQTRVDGDTFILCTFPLMWGGEPLVLDSNNSAEQVCAEIPRFLQEEDETISLCRVGFWVYDEAEGMCRPQDVTTIFQIQPFDTDALDEELEDDEE